MWAKPDVIGERDSIIQIFAPEKADSTISYAIFNYEKDGNIVGMQENNRKMYFCDSTYSKYDRSEECKKENEGKIMITPGKTAASLQSGTLDSIVTYPVNATGLYYIVLHQTTSTQVEITARVLNPYGDLSAPDFPKLQVLPSLLFNLVLSSISGIVCGYWCCMGCIEHNAFERTIENPSTISNSFLFRIISLL
jgi:hypothetical protein